MSGETLRRAAALMRARAEAAMPANGNRWESYDLPDTGPNRWRMTGVGVVGDEMGHRAEAMFASDATYIASWHPTVALAVADLLEQVAESDFQDLGFAETCTSVGSEALAVAVAYLQEAP